MAAMLPHDLITPAITSKLTKQAVCQTQRAAAVVPTTNPAPPNNAAMLRQSKVSVSRGL